MEKNLDLCCVDDRTGQEKINKTCGELSEVVTDTLSPRLFAEPLRSMCDDLNQSERERFIYLALLKGGLFLYQPFGEDRKDRKNETERKKKVSLRCVQKCLLGSLRELGQADRRSTNIPRKSIHPIKKDQVDLSDRKAINKEEKKRKKEI